MAPRSGAAAGGFGEHLTNYGREDWELGPRLLKAGRRFRIWSAAAAEHRPSWPTTG